MAVRRRRPRGFTRPPRSFAACGCSPAPTPTQHLGRGLESHPLGPHPGAGRVLRPARLVPEGLRPAPGGTAERSVPHGGGGCSVRWDRAGSALTVSVCSARPPQLRPRLRWPAGLGRVSLHLLQVQGHRRRADGTGFMPVPGDTPLIPSPGPSGDHRTRVHLKGGGRSGGVCTQCAHPACTPWALPAPSRTSPAHTCPAAPHLHPTETLLHSTPTPLTPVQLCADWGSCSPPRITSVLHSRQEQTLCPQNKGDTPHTHTPPTRGSSWEQTGDHPHPITPRLSRTGGIDSAGTGLRSPFIEAMLWGTPGDCAKARWHWGCARTPKEATPRWCSSSTSLRPCQDPP